MGGVSITREKRDRDRGGGGGGGGLSERMEVV